MAEKASRGPAEDAPKSAARFVRRSAAAIRARTAGLSQYRAEYQALIEWAELHGRLLSFSFIEQFSFIGDGAEHRVYKDDAGQGAAIKATHPNKFGYSVSPRIGWATPVEYLKRLAWQNLIFGDEIRILGVAHDEGQMEVVTSQPWISPNEIRPNPTKEEIDEYMGGFGFVSTSPNLDSPLYFSKRRGLVVADAHDRNVIRDQNGELAAIDLVIGPPDQELLQTITSYLNQTGMTARL